MRGNHSTVTHQSDKLVEFKIKYQRTADCVVAGRCMHSSSKDAIRAMLLRLYGHDCTLPLGRRDRGVPDGQEASVVCRNVAAGRSFDDHSWDWAAHEAGERTPRKNETSHWNAATICRSCRCDPTGWSRSDDDMEGQRFRPTTQSNRW